MSRDSFQTAYMAACMAAYMAAYMAACTANLKPFKLRWPHLLQRSGSPSESAIHENPQS